MLFNRRTFALFLAVIMLVSSVLFALTGCTPKDPNGNNTEDTADTSTPETENAGAPSEFTLVENGVSKVKVIRHQDLNTDDTSVQVAINIRNQLQALTDAEVSIADDWIKPGESYNDNLEILVCASNYPQSQEVMSSLKYGDYEIRVVGNKIVLVGYTDSAISAAGNYLISAIKKAVVAGENGEKSSIVIKKENIEVVATKNKIISQMPTVDNGKFYAYYDPGDNCDELIFEKATPEIYAAYLTKLESAGYKKYTSHDIKENSFTTLYNDDYTLNVGYYTNNKQIRLVIEPFSNATLIGLESDNKYDVVTTSQITMIGLAYKASDGSMTNNGLSILIRLTDGRFMVVDGGFNRSNDATMLINQMKQQSKDYAAKTGGIKVAAWMITHAHGDHSGMIGKQFNAFKTAGIQVERFIVNFMSDTERNKSINSKTYGSNWSNGEGSGYTSVIDAAAALGSEYVVAHVGQVFYFADVAMEVLYTIESYGPSVTNAFNTTSVIIKMTFTDPKTGAKTVYMSTGDATGPAFKICNMMYGDYLKSDIVQVAHHGYTTWGTEDGTIGAYTKMAPPTLLWPQGSSAYPNYKNKSYNAVLWNSTNPNWQETYVAGEEGNVVIVPLPYTVGSANVAPTDKK